MHQKMVDITLQVGRSLARWVRTSQELAAELVGTAPARGSEPALKELVTLLNKPLVKVRRAKDLRLDAVLCGRLVVGLVDWF